MCLTRRGFLAGSLLVLGLPRPARAESVVERQHRVQLDVPILAEDPTAVPIRVWVDHPMEPDHHIRAVEVAVDADPVPLKGRFLFTPANGRASVAFQMRSGRGGLVRAVAECSRHGRFVGTAPLRVVEGGCTTAPDRATRDRIGNPMLRVPPAPRPGEVVEVRAKIDHSSHTGLALREGRFVREAPEFYIAQMLVYVDEQPISEFQMTSAVSPNPLVRFPLRVPRGGTLRVVFVNNEGQRWEVSRPLRG